MKLKDSVLKSNYHIPFSESVLIHVVKGRINSQQRYKIFIIRLYVGEYWLSFSQFLKDNDQCRDHGSKSSVI